MTDLNKKTGTGSDIRSIAIKAALIIFPIIGGYFLIDSMLVEKEAQPIGNPNPIARKYGTEVLTSVYPDLDADQIDRLLTESWSRTLAYETFTQFKEHSREGEYVNIDKAGFRIGRNQGPWPPLPDNFNIFVFGGSVTFGYGERDEHTVPSFLQEILSRELGETVYVYNFGRGHYYSRQELLLYENLLLKGYVPDVALFIDGSNDFYYANNKALFSSQFEQLTTQNLAPEEQGKGQKAREIYPVAERYMATKDIIEAISAVFGVNSIFAWHPIPLYKYDLEYHLFAKEGFPGHKWAGPAYRFMAAYLVDHKPGKNFIWCADIQDGLQESLYVDRFHYTSRLARMTAQCIGNGILQRGLVSAEDVRKQAANK